MAIRRSATVALGTAALVALCGCSDPAIPASSRTPAATVRPIYTSEDDALKAASDAYQRYLTLGSLVASEGGLEPERMAQVTVGEAYQRELSTFTGMHDRGERGVGTQTFDSVRIQRYSPKEPTMTLYLCLDTSGTQLLKSDGSSANREDRPTRYPLQIEMTIPSNANDGPLLMKSDSWTGKNFC